MAVVAADALIGRRLQVDAVQRQTVERAEQLVLVVGVDALDHVEVGLTRLAPRTPDHLRLVRLEAHRAHRRTEVPQLPLELDRLRRAAVEIARLAAVFALAHRQLIGVAERDEARLTAQLVHLTAERDLVHDWPHLVAHGALRLVGLGARAWAGHATGAGYLYVGIAIVTLRVLLELAQTPLTAEVAERQVAADRRHEGLGVGGDVLAALRA